MTQMRKLEEQVGAWPHVSVHPPARRSDVSSVSETPRSDTYTLGGTVDIPFTRSVRDALLADGLAEEHRWVPNSGWTTFHVQSEGDLQHALWLMRLSYLRYSLKTSTDPQKLFEEESRELGLSPRFKLLLEPFVPKTPKHVSAEAVPA